MTPFGSCRSCGRPIYWASTGSKRIPLIADPLTLRPAEFPPDDSNTGRIQAIAEEFDLAGALVATVVAVLPEDADTNPNRPIWRSHFADCPHSNDWRKPQPGGRRRR